MAGGSIIRWAAWLLSSGLGLGLGVATAWAQPSGPDSVQHFFSPAQLQGARLSPSGRWMMAQTSTPGRRVGLMLFDLQGSDAPRFIEASPKDDVIEFHWVSDDWLVFKVVSPADRSNRPPGPGLVALRRDGRESRLLINREYEYEDAMQRKRYLNPDHFYLALGAPGSNEVIVGQAVWDAQGEFSHVEPRAINVTSGTVRSLLDKAPRADAWLFDSQSRARVARHTVAGVTTTHWADQNGVWRVIAKAPMYKQRFSPRYVDGEGGLVVSTTERDGSMALRRFDFDSGQPRPEALVATPGFDSGFSVRRHENGTVLGLDLLTDADTPLWFSPTMKALQATVDAKFPDHLNTIECRRCDKPDTVLIFSRSDRDPGHIILWRPQQDKWQLLGDSLPGIDPRRMAALDFHRSKARDGEDLPIWVSLPPAAAGTAAAAPKPMPAVVLVHGGPFSRGSSWRWKAEAQFLASRGYVVIEPEFRGSRGYGENHHRAGWKQWGQAMQDDVTDALRFAVGKGWVDPGRVCIMGSSFGGYAALMGLIREPDSYRCGIAHAALSDLRALYDFHWSDESEHARRYALPVVMGDKLKDAALLAAGSAVDQAAQIKAPLLLAHGSLDRRVPIEHAERMLAKLRQAGRDVEWQLYPDEGHGFFFDQNRFDYYRRVEAFLAKHLK